MVLDETSFAQVLERLEKIRDELVRTSNPETVQTLHDEARRLVHRGEQVLGRGLEPAPPRTAPAGSVPHGQSPAGRATTGQAAADQVPAGQASAGHVPAAQDGAVPAAPPAPAAVAPGAGDEATTRLRPASESGAEAASGDDAPTQQAATARPWPGDADTTQVIPTTGR